MSEIKSCPFCGAHAGADGPVLQVSEQGHHYVWCGGCGASGPEQAFFQSDAIPAWNRRARLGGTRDEVPT